MAMDVAVWRSLRGSEGNAINVDWGDMWSYKVKSAIPHNFLKKFCCEGENYEVVAKGTY